MRELGLLARFLYGILFPKTLRLGQQDNIGGCVGIFRIFDWLFRNVPLGEGQYERNPLTPINRWKIADNLRRAPSYSIGIF